MRMELSMFFSVKELKNGGKIKYKSLISWLQWKSCTIVLGTVLVWIDMFLVMFREDFHLIRHVLMCGEI